MIIFLIGLISVDALNTQSDNLSTMYPTKVHVLAPYELEAAIKFFTINQEIVGYKSVE